MYQNLGSFLRIGCWNVNGLTNKLTEKEFIRSIEGYDILCLQETKCDKEKGICIDDYVTHAVYRPTEKNYPVSGGMLFLLNPGIISGISISENTCSEIQWLKLCKHYFSLENDLYICFTYMAPEHSSYVLRHNLDILSIIEKDISHYSNLGDIMLFGDTNARTGVENDLLDANCTHLPAPFLKGNTGSFLKRKSQDSVCNSRGKEFIDLCISANLVILNGRTFGDLGGKPTCFQYNGNSVVDYCVVSDELFDKVLYFQVENHIPFLSDHAKLNVKLYAKFKTVNIESTLLDMPTSWKWTDTSSLDFKIALSSIEIKQKIESFDSDPLQNVDQMVTNLNDILYTACNKSMKKKLKVKKTRPVQSK